MMQLNVVKHTMIEYHLLIALSSWFH